MKSFLVFVSFLLIIVLVSETSFAQNKKTVINGKITSFEESLPLEGVSIAVKKGKNITGSQADGTFTLEVSNEDKVLVITLQGYEKQEVKLTSIREYNIVLKRNGVYCASDK